MYVLPCIGPATPPRNCTATAITSTTIRVTWMIPSEPNGPIDHYDVAYQPVQSISGIDYTTQTGLVGINSTADDSPELIVSNLFKATSYSFIITAYNAIGPSPNSTELCVAYTMEDGKFSYNGGICNLNRNKHNSIFFVCSARRSSFES